MQQSSRNKSAEKHLCSEQTPSNMSRNSRLKNFHISRDTNKLILHVIKQCLQAVHHLCCRSYSHYATTIVCDPLSVGTSLLSGQGQDWQTVHSLWQGLLPGNPCLLRFGLPHLGLCFRVNLELTFIINILTA